MIRTPRQRWVLPVAGAALYCAAFPLQIAHGNYYCSVARQRGLDDVCDAPAMLLMAMAYLSLFVVPLLAAFTWLCLKGAEGGEPIVTGDLSVRGILAGLMTLACWYLAMMVFGSRNGDGFTNPWDYAFSVYWIAFGFWFLCLRAAVAGAKNIDR